MAVYDTVIAKGGVDMAKKQYTKEDALTMTVDEVAEALGVSKYLVWEMVRRNEIRSIKLGKLRRIPRSALMELLEGNAGEGNSTSKSP